MPPRNPVSPEVRSVKSAVRSATFASAFVTKSSSSLAGSLMVTVTGYFPLAAYVLVPTMSNVSTASGSG